MSQPDWECIAQLGDVNPLDYGGYWVLRDKTGVYAEEGELLIVSEDHEGGGDDGDEMYLVYRFILERCTYVNGVLSDNKFHPEHPAWFADSIDSIASSIGMSNMELMESLWGDNPLKRAAAYHAIGYYHGFENLDSYPLQLSRSEVEQRYSDAKYGVVK